MAVLTKADLFQRMNALIRSGGQGGKTKAVQVREFVVDLIDTIFSLFGQSSSAGGILEYDPEAIYDFENNPFAVFNFRIFKTKIDGQTGNEPPFSPDGEGNYEDDNWIEISPAPASGIAKWKAGVYTGELVIVYHEESLYRLDIAPEAMPFESVDIVAETRTEANPGGAWVVMDGGTVNQFSTEIYLNKDYDWNDFVQVEPINFTKAPGTFKPLKCGRVKILTNGDGITWSSDFINAADFQTESLPDITEALNLHIFFMWSEALGKIIVNIPTNSEGTIGGPVNGAPSATQNLIATAVAGGAITLNWTTPEDDGGAAISHYEIYRESPAGDGFSVLVANTGSTSTTYNDSGLVGGQQYNYKIRAHNANGAGLFSNEANATATTVIAGTFDFQPNNPVNISVLSDTSVQKSSDTTAYDATTHAIYRVKSGSGRIRWKLPQTGGYFRIGFNQTGTTIGNIEAHVFNNNGSQRLTINTVGIGTAAPNVSGTNFSRLYELYIFEGNAYFRYSDDEGNEWTDVASGPITLTYPYDIEIQMYSYQHIISDLRIIGDDFELDPR